MENIAVVVFGGAGGVEVIEEPRGFSIGEPLRQTVDISYPFQWGKEVYRAVSFEEAGSQYLYLTLHTKIDDLGGPREGAHAGAGVFIRDGICDGAIVVDVLRRMLSRLIKEASNGHQFTSKLPAIESSLRSSLVSGVDTLARVFQPTKVKFSKTTSDYTISIVDASDWRVATAEQFIEFASQMLLYEGGHYLYASDQNMRNEVPITGEYKKINLGKKLLELSSIFATSYVQAEESRQELQAQLKNTQIRLQEVEVRSTHLSKELAVMTPRGERADSLQLERDANVQKLIKIEIEMARVIRERDDALRQQVANKLPVIKGNTSAVEANLKLEIKQKSDHIDSLYNQIDDYKQNYTRASKSGTVTKRTLYIIVTILIVFFAAVIFVIKLLDSTNKNQINSLTLEIKTIKEKSINEINAIKLDAEKRIAAAKNIESEKIIIVPTVEIRPKQTLKPVTLLEKNKPLVKLPTLPSADKPAAEPAAATPAPADKLSGEPEKKTPESKQ